MEVFTSTDTAHLPQSVLSVKSKNGLNYASTSSTNPTIDFELPASIGYYLAEDLVLSFDFEYTATDGKVYNLRPQNNGGMAGIINQLSIYSIQDGVLLEEIQDYHLLNGALMSHNNGSDKEMKDGTFKRLSKTEGYTNDYDDITPYVSPNSHPATPTTAYAPLEYQSQKIQLPIRLSTLLSASQVIPVGALGGLRIRLQLNPPETFNQLHGYEVDDLVVVDNGAVDNFVYVDNSTLIYSPNQVLVVAGVNDTLTFTPAGGAPTDLVIPEADYTKANLIIALNTALTASPVAGLSIALNGATIDYGNTTAVIIGVAGNLQVNNLSGLAEIPATTASITTAINSLTTTFTPAFSGNAVALKLALNTGMTATLGANKLEIEKIVWDGDSWVITFDNQAINNQFTLGGTLTTTLLAGASSYSIAIQPAETNLPLVATNEDITKLYLPQQNFYLNNPKDISTCPFKVGSVLEVAGLSTTSSIESIAPSDNGLELTMNGEVNVAVRNLLAVASRKIRTLIGAGVVQYSLKNVSLELPVITPPPSYVVALQKAITSEGGMRMDMKSFSLVRSNIQAGQTLVSMNLPFVSTRAKGLISIPHQVVSPSLLTRTGCDNFNLLRLTKYFYEYHGVKHPERGIDTDKARQGSLSQELMMENHKAYNYCFDDKLISLDGFANAYKAKTFYLGRNLGVFNTTFNTINSNMNLTLEATSTAGGAESSLNVNHYCNAVNTLVMRAGGVSLER